MKVILISGVTGTIGNALFESYVMEKDSIVIGLSRRGITTYTNLSHHVILSLDLDSKGKIGDLVNEIYKLNPSEIIYYHCIGAFKTEIHPHTLQRKIDIDHDKDGLDDETLRDVYTYLKNITEQLITRRKRKTKISIVTFGSIAEEYDLEIFHSWTMVRKKSLEMLRGIASKTENFTAYNILISTLLSAKEMLARPYVFGTDADPKYWLKAGELAKRAKSLVSKSATGFYVKKIFKKAPHFQTNHFENDKMKVRRVYELHGKNILQ